MRLPRWRRWLISGAGLAAMSGLCPDVTPAQALLHEGEWTPFHWFDGVGPIADPRDGFALTLLAPGRLRVVDAFTSGDAFDLFVDGALRLATPAVAPGIDGGTTGDAAWADPALSRGEISLAPGSYRLDVRVRVDAGFGYGDGYLRVDRTGASVVPEPRALVLLTTGLAGIACMRRRRRHRG